MSSSEHLWPISVWEKVYIAIGVLTGNCTAERGKCIVVGEDTDSGEKEFF